MNSSSQLNIWLLALAICLAIVSSSTSAKNVGEVVSEIKLSSFENQIRLINTNNKVTYIDFWASWCKPCAKSFPFMESMHQKYHADGLNIVAVNLDEDIDDANQFLSNQTVNFGVYRDINNQLAEEFEIPGLPTSYVLDKNGKLMAIHQGFSRKKADKLEQQISFLLEQL